MATYLERGSAPSTAQASLCSEAREKRALQYVGQVSFDERIVKLNIFAVGGFGQLEWSERSCLSKIP